MVTKAELLRKHKLKILLKGPTGSGKTYSCIKIANEVARRGWKVLYLDQERGSEEELLKLDDDILQNIMHEDCKNYKEIMENIKRYTKDEKDKLKLIIVDPMPLIEMSRMSARDAFLDQGYYYLGEKKVEIDNKETFDLRGFMYQLATTYQFKFLNEIISCPQDIVCTLMTPTKYDNEYDGKFSIILETFTAWVGNKIFYKAIPKKMRGVDLSMMPAIDNPHERLLEGFIRKYDSLESSSKQNIVNEKSDNSVNDESDKDDDVKQSTDNTASDVQ
jgi:adenylate kinase family enzyme